MATRIVGAEQVSIKLGKLIRTCQNPTRPMTEATAHIEDKLQQYPPATGKPQPFKTDRQRRFFFAALREGRISVPYRRTRTLGRQWTTRVSNGGKRGTVGNNTPYAPLVQGQQQAGYHAGNWQNTEQVAESEADEVKGFFLEEIRRQTR